MIRLRPYKPGDAWNLLEWWENAGEEEFLMWSCGEFSYPLAIEELDGYFARWCLQETDGWLMTALDEKGTPVQFRDYPRSCNFHDKGRTISATAASGRREGVPAGTSQKTCRPPFVRSFRVEEPDDAICPAGIICPYRRGRCRIAFIPATPQPKSPFPTVTGHGASVRSAGSAAEDDSTGIVAMKGGEETLRNASPTGFHADARPKISHPLPSDACQL